MRTGKCGSAEECLHRIKEAQTLTCGNINLGNVKPSPKEKQNKTTTKNKPGYNAKNWWSQFLVSLRWEDFKTTSEI